jgi:hypothetical protein
MGSSSALSSLNRVLKKHGKEIRTEIKGYFPSNLIKDIGIGCENSCYRLGAVAILTDGTELPLEIDWLDIDSLAERYPDCDVGY